MPDSNKRRRKAANENVRPAFPPPLVETPYGPLNDLTEYARQARVFGLPVYITPSCLETISRDPAYTGQVTTDWRLYDIVWMALFHELGLPFWKFPVRLFANRQRGETADVRLVLDAGRLPLSRRRTAVVIGLPEEVTDLLVRSLRRNG